MNKSVPLLSVPGLLGGLCVCLLAFQVNASAQSSEPAGVNVEAPATDETKPADANAAANNTEILASQGATFAAKDRIAVFSGDVRVKDPRFALACDKLTVYLAKGAVPGGAPTPPPVETPPATKSGESSRGSGIDRAVAEGHVIIIQKHAPAKPGEEEKTSVGRADIAEFDNKTGDMTLRGMPSVEQNGNRHEALSRSTYMILHSDNSLDTHGPSRTTFVPQKGKDNLPGGAPGNKAGTTPPAGSPAGRRPSTSGTQS